MKGKKTGGRDFKPGQSGNPNGRPKIPSDIRELRKINQSSVEVLLNKYLHMKFPELKQMIEAQDAEASDMLVATVIYKGITKGDHYRLNFLLDRLIGKVTDKVEVKLPVPTIIERPNGMRVELGAKLEDEEEEDNE